jgi:glutaryl-CoA dehydrogenase
VSLTPLIGDFYGYESRLGDREKESLAELRSYLEQEVRPHVNGWWARAEFPRHVVGGLAERGFFGMPFPETRRFENSAVFRSSDASTRASRPSSACRAGW